MEKSPQIEFTVKGKPPKKTKKSLWSIKSPQTDLVINLRKRAFEASKERGLTDPFHGPVKLTLTVCDPNPLERKDRHDYLGDLDALIGGVFESLQPSPPENNNLKIHPLLKEKNEICHDVPLIVDDDAQISTTIAKKRENKDTFYTVIIEDDDLQT